MCAGLFPVAFDLFPSTLVTGSGHSPPLLHRNVLLGTSRSSRGRRRLRRLVLDIVLPLLSLVFAIFVVRVWGGHIHGCSIVAGEKERHWDVVVSKL